MKNRQKPHIRAAFLAVVLAFGSAVCMATGTAVFSSCTSDLGWGVLLWATEDPFIPSGTVLRVYIQSSIDKVWVVGLPDGLRSSSGLDKIEIPLSHLELVGNQSKAQQRAQDFEAFALTYAETLQVGLPIRANPENNARRVYRLRGGEIVKIISLVDDGVAPLGVTGEPLPGSWYKVLTEDGTTGYAFSYRLRIFSDGAFSGSGSAAGENRFTSDLEMLFSQDWVPRSYLTMVENGKVDIGELSRRWNFDPGHDTSVAQIFTAEVNQPFQYTQVVPSGDRSWRFEGTSLSAKLVSDTSLTLSFTDGTGAQRTMDFVALPGGIDGVIEAETNRRDALFSAIFESGPVFASSSFGIITFRREGSFTWNGYSLLVPQYIPEGLQGYGNVSMDLLLSPSLAQTYTGAMTMRFTNSSGGEAAVLHVLYTIDRQGLRMEIVPSSGIQDATVTERASSPMVLFFSADN